VNRKTLLIALLIVSLALAAAWSRQHMLHRRHAADLARDTLADCRRIAASIASIRDRPAVAADGEAMGGEIQAAIENVAADAGISKDKLIRISPMPAQRLADSAYMEKPTHVRLDDVTLEQMVTLLHRLAAKQQGLVAKSIQLRSPQADDTGDLWVAEIELTYLIYEPTEKGR